MPPDYVDLMTCFEWGISWDEYQNTDIEIIGKLKAYRHAQSVGEERKQASIESQSKNYKK